MKIILLKDIPKIGRKFEVKDMSDGYALNFVIPKGLGMKATTEALAKLDKDKKEHQVKVKITEDLLRKDIEAVSKDTIKIEAKANENGHLFAGISAKELSEEIEKQTRIKLESHFILLDKPIREVGNFILDIDANGIKSKIKVEVSTKN